MEVKRWKADTTRKNHLRLLPFGPDRVRRYVARAAFRGFYTVRPL